MLTLKTNTTVSFENAIKEVDLTFDSGNSILDVICTLIREGELEDKALVSSTIQAAIDEACL